MASLVNDAGITSTDSSQSQVFEECMDALTRMDLDTLTKLHNDNNLTYRSSYQSYCSCCEISDGYGHIENNVLSERFTSGDHRKDFTPNVSIEQFALLLESGIITPFDVDFLCQYLSKLNCQGCVDVFVELVKMFDHESIRNYRHQISNGPSFVDYHPTLLHYLYQTLISMYEKDVMTIMRYLVDEVGCDPSIETTYQVITTGTPSTNVIHIQKCRIVDMIIYCGHYQILAWFVNDKHYDPEYDFDNVFYDDDGYSCPQWMESLGRHESDRYTIFVDNENKLTKFGEGVFNCIKFIRDNGFTSLEGTDSTGQSLSDHIHRLHLESTEFVEFL